MSFNSPAKQERIERHLMRQRGAGVRTVSVNFGFSFGTSVPPSSDAISAQAEPPAKRRETLLQNITSVSAADTSTPYLEVTNGIQGVRKTKRRRRFAPGEVEEKAHKSQESTGEDSFVLGLENKKKSRIVQKEVVQDSDVAVENVAPTTRVSAQSRARKRGANSAAVKAYDDLHEKPVPVGKKQRDVEPKKSTVKLRKKQNDPVQLATKEPNHEPTAPIMALNKSDKVPQQRHKATDSISRQEKTGKATLDGLEDDTILITKKRTTVEVKKAAGRTRAKQANSAHMNAIESDFEPVQPVQLPQDFDKVPQPPSKTTKSTSRKRKPTETTSEPSLRYEREDNEGNTTSVDFLPGMQVQPKTLPAQRARKSTVNTSKCIEDLAMRRQPLQETDMNVIPRSISPEKSKHEEEKTMPPCHRGAKGKQKDEIASTTSTKRTSKRKKMEVQGDETPGAAASNAEPILASKDTVVDLCDLIGHIDSQPVELETPSCSGKRIAVDQAVTEIEAKAATARNAVQQSRSERPNNQRRTNRAEVPMVESRSKVVPKAVPAHIMEDDIDWLFESQESIRKLPRSNGQKPVPTSGASKKRSKMVDIDLDDLLSNIAAFANDQAAMTVAKDPDRFLSTQKKPKTSRGRNAKA